MNSFLKQLYMNAYSQLCNDEGQNLVEYALIIVMVALGCVAGINSVTSAINNVFSSISATLS